jgi:XTP/dITP diphosphohydrolase
VGWKDVKKILFATKNYHKVLEVNSVLRNCGFEAEAYTSIPKLELQLEDLETVALIAAANAYSSVRRPIIVEDAGLFIEALNGFPGPYSSYVYRTIGIQGILKLMEGISNRRARFVSVIALAYRDGIMLFKGEVEGEITYEPRGKRGFGFDPIFVPEGSTKTFAEMTPEEKSLISHRGRAARKLCEWLKDNSKLL